MNGKEALSLQDRQSMWLFVAPRWRSGSRASLTHWAPYIALELPLVMPIYAVEELDQHR
jgi:hypothetical protein